MAPSRKRRGREEGAHLESGHGNNKKARRSGKRDAPVDQTKYGLLKQFYPSVQTLRQYLVSSLPSSSRLRRKKIASVGLTFPSSDQAQRDLEASLCRLLDTSLVACEGPERTEENDTRWGQWLEFSSQRADESDVTLSEGLVGAIFSQSEIVDFVIWLLFSRKDAGDTWPKHLLCDGFRKTAGHATRQLVPGIFSLYPNQQVQKLKEAPWPQLLKLLGQSGERMMIDLLTDCAIFIAIDAGEDNLLQLSGVPLSELETTAQKAASKAAQKSSGNPAQGASPPRGNADITFVRSRMLYARAALNAQGQVLFGLRHIHVLNRCPYDKSHVPSSTNNHAGSAVQPNTLKVMMYMFPRQHGLHNVFTSKVDFTKTSQRLQDYTLREEEIKTFQSSLKDAGKDTRNQIPKRLRREAVRLVERLQILHGRCAYSKLLRHYCPTPFDSVARKKSLKKHGPVSNQAAPTTTQCLASQRAVHRSAANQMFTSTARERSKSKLPTGSQPRLKYEIITDLATSTTAVSAFCRAVIYKVIPHDFWGSQVHRAYNMQLFMKRIDHFVKLRRFEAMSLHEVVEGIKITHMEWLVPPHLQGHKTSQTDMQKRREILHEFLYYIFDSIVMPLIRSNFYVTESSVHRHRLFYFRHDVWRHIAEPAMAALKVQMLEEVRLDAAMRVLGSRKLGFSQIRLLPKETSMRPIMNLRRRPTAIGDKNILGPSINSILNPVYTALKLEKAVDPTRLGASLFSVGDIYSRLKSFRQQLGVVSPKLYFAKLDVKSAFDTIPQDAVVRLMRRVATRREYKFVKYVEVRPGRLGNATKPLRSWQSVAMRGDDATPLLERIETDLAKAKRRTVFVGNALQRKQPAEALLGLMESHIQQNFAKIGKKYFKQKTGIPQGSILSSTLCNYFYADLETTHLGFLSGPDCLLLRLIDDFLLITTQPDKAQAFINVMHKGLPDYGVTVSPAKTLVNFDMQMDGQVVTRVADNEGFPYCGTIIDCDTLDVGKNRQHAKHQRTSDSLTVDFGRAPGHNFERKVLNAFKIQSHVMFYDTNHNSLPTVCRNLFEALSETAAKIWAYMRSLSDEKLPSPGVVIRTITKLVNVAFVLLTSKHRRAKFSGYVFALSKSQVTWIAFHAIRAILQQKQSRYREVVGWLGHELSKLESKKGIRDVELMQRIADNHGSLDR